MKMTLITFGEKEFVTKKDISLALFCGIISRVSPWLKPDIEFNPATYRYECYSKENLAVFAYTTDVAAIGYDSEWFKIELVEEI